MIHRHGGFDGLIRVDLFSVERRVTRKEDVREGSYKLYQQNSIPY